MLLYPKNHSLAPRTLEFSRTQVNVITGTSQKGKSAIGKILDYCLASSTCQIPKGPIRTTVEWYAVGLFLEGEYMFIARKEPGDERSSREFFMQSDSNPFVPLPAALARNTSLDQMKTILNKKAGLAHIPVETAEQAQKSYGGAMGFRDLMAFNFLPQHIVANPQTLFYRTDNAVYFERLKKVLPLAIGVISQEGLLAELEHARLQKDIRTLKGELNVRQEAMKTWQQEAQAFYQKSVELGLVPEELLDNDTNSYSDRLKRVKDCYDRGERPSPVGMAARYAQHLTYTKNRMQKLERERSTLKRRLLKCSAFDHTVEKFQHSLQSQQDRMSVAEKLADLSQESVCPMCGTAAVSALPRLVELAQESASLATRVGRTDNVRKSHFLDMTQQLQKELGETEDRIWKVQMHLKRLEGQQQNVKVYQDREREAARMIGKIEQLLETATGSEATEEMKARLNKLDTEARELAQQHDFSKRSQRTKAALGGLTEKIAAHAKALSLEWADAKPAIDPSHLTLYFTTPGKKQQKTYLSELGSGENWMGYHIATFLALHGLFSNQGDECPVPSFLLIDQPTQVYFPAKTNTYDNRDDLHLDDDVRKATNIFRVLHDALGEMEEPPQVIVTEHADKDTWGEFDVNEVANWRDGRTDSALIPKDWLDDEEPPPK